MTSSAPPEAGRLPDQQVRAMFDRIAGVYDLMNGVMTAGLHHRWRSRAADLARVAPGDRVLDVATGTGDLAVELKRRGCDVVGSDFSEEMLARARVKEPAIAWEWADAMQLPYEDDAFAAATVGFGARNFGDLDRGIAEMARVVRPGGRVVVLEITTPTKPPLSTFFSIWFDQRRPAARPPQRLGRLHVPARLGAPLPRRPAARRRARGRRPDRRRLAADRRRDHRHPPRDGPGLTTTADPAVARIVEAGGAQIPRLLAQVEERLVAVATGHGPVLAEHAGATIAAGGKRLRPLLVLLVRRAGRAGRPAVRAAAAVELVHSATLVHDDVLDDAALRRGRPTVYAAAGRGMATATGDLLFSRAFAELADNGDAEQVRVLSWASSALARGELVQREDAWDAGVARRPLPDALRAEDRAAVRGGVPARRARRRPRGRRGARRRSAIGSGWRSSSSTTSSTCRARRSGRASTAAPTCSTAR